MITVHVSPSRHLVYLEHVPEYGSIALSPESAYSILMRLEERKTDIYSMVLSGKDAKYDCADCGGVHPVGTPCPTLREKATK